MRHAILFSTALLIVWAVSYAHSSEPNEYDHDYEYMSEHDHGGYDEPDHDYANEHDHDGGSDHDYEQYADGEHEACADCGTEEEPIDPAGEHDNECVAVADTPVEKSGLGTKNSPEVETGITDGVRFAHTVWAEHTKTYNAVTRDKYDRSTVFAQSVHEEWNCYLRGWDARSNLTEDIVTLEESKILENGNRGETSLRDYKVTTYPVNERNGELAAFSDQAIVSQDTYYTYTEMDPEGCLVAQIDVYYTDNDREGTQDGSKRECQNYGYQKYCETTEYKDGAIVSMYGSMEDCEGVGAGEF